MHPPALSITALSDVCQGCGQVRFTIVARVFLSPNPLLPPPSDRKSRQLAFTNRDIAFSATILYIAPYWGQWVGYGMNVA
mgnify:CR=1 FL=1